MSRKTSLNFLLLFEKVFFPKKIKEFIFCVDVSIQVVKTEPLVSKKFLNLASPVSHH